MQWVAVHIQSESVQDAPGGLQVVVHTALALTPHVCMDGDHTVLLEVASTLRLWGGLQRLLPRLEQALQALDIGRFSLACAPTPGAAALFARAQRGVSLPGPAWQKRLDALAIAHLHHGRDHASAMAGMGLHTVAHLRALPRAGVARRWGEALWTEVDRARGEKPDPRAWIQPEAVFDERLELPAKAHTTSQVMQGAQRLILRLVAWAGAQHARVARFVLHLLPEPRVPTGRPLAALALSTAAQEEALEGALEVSLAEPSSDGDHLLFMLRERLAHTPAIAPTLELRLRCEAIVRTPAPHGELFPTRASEKEGLTRMLERLQARLGSGAVRTLETHADHRPERATSLIPVCLKTLRTVVHESHPSPPHLTRPVWLWPTPQPLKEQRGRPWLEGHPLQLLAGPERVESGWWDDRPALRDYFIAQAHDGSLVWVYRSRLALTPEDSGWFLHGRFA